MRRAIIFLIFTSFGMINVQSQSKLYICIVLGCVLLPKQAFAQVLATMYATLTTKAF